MPEENPRIVTQIVGREMVRHVDTPEGMFFLAQIFVGRETQVMARVNFEFPFEKLIDGALDQIQIVEVLRKQFHMVEEVRKKRIGAENS